MNIEPAVTYLMFRTLWAAIGMFLGLYALISVWKTRWGTVNLSAKMMWWFQIVITPLSGLFWLWVTMAFRGLVWPIGWVALMVILWARFWPR